VQNKWVDLVDKKPLLQTRVFLKVFFPAFTVFRARILFLLKYLGA
jgi:hypothetical protein